MLWSQPAMAAAGSPNPGKAGHVAIANATHLIAVGGMGALGALDAPSDTADILDLGKHAPGGHEPSCRAECQGCVRLASSNACAPRCFACALQRAIGGSARACAWTWTAS